MEVCPYLEYAFSILGKKWNGLILHYLSLCANSSAHFSELKRDLTDITSRALSLKLSELINYGLIEKKVTASSAVIISYELTDKGRSLTAALMPVQSWAQQYENLPGKEDNNDEKREYDV
ncbi:winged helix-turn-helix transcriptional regulator [Paenibacillus lentus]|uniref:winged helix-turn-helix transcriptional regulator n=1 Tax=Paenibacillus lentus TaxID=1338368 RepID=UPI003646E1B8